MTPYEQLLARLLPARRFGIVLGLERMHAIFERLGHPERRLGRVVHVGGTNGKGSTVAMIAALLRLAPAVHGRPPARVAAYTSPHLSCLRERIRFDEEMISEAALVAAADRVREVGGAELTFFEQLTAIACVAIAERGVDYTVLEVGLGGRLDATNAVPAEIAVVTGVAMDHAAILGDTLDAIAREKAGIFKPRQQVVIGASGEPAAVPVLIDEAGRVGAKARVIDDAAVERLRAGMIRGEAARFGAFQLRNAAAAVAAVATLESLPDDGWLRDLLSIHNLPPGRFEIVETDDADIILDGAHNPHAAAALAAELRARDLQPTVIVAVSSDKDVAGIAAALVPAVRHAIATRYQQDRALPPDQLAAILHAAKNQPVATRDPRPGSNLAEAAAGDVDTAPDLATALACAREVAARDFVSSVIHPRPTILVTGSLFLIGEARVLLLGAPADPYVVTDPPAR